MHFQSYNEHLRELTHLIVDMGKEVGAAIQCAHESLTAKDAEHRENVKNLDKTINQFDRTINEQAIALLTMRHPMGDDLRFVASAFVISSDLERAGDLAKNIAKRSLKIGEYNPVAVMGKMGEMVIVIMAMVTDVIAAIEKRNADLAFQVWRKDKEVDKLYNEILSLLQKEIQENTAPVQAITHLMFAVKNFERIADYTTSLSRTVYYVTTGKQADKQVLKENTAHG